MYDVQGGSMPAENPTVSADQKKKEVKPKYNMWQNTAYMIASAHRYYRRILYMGVVLAVMTSAKEVMNMLIAPMVLSELEAGRSPAELLIIIGIGIALLTGFSGGKAYLEQNVIFARIALRTEFIRMLGRKNATTSYVNTLDNAFIELRDKAFRATSSNWEASERIWPVLTSLTANLLSFGVYLFLISTLNPLIMLAVFLTTWLNYLVSSRIFEWEHRHRKEQEAILNKLSYLDRTVTKREYAKDIRIFGMEGWLRDVWNSTIRLYAHFLARRERVYIWADISDLVLTLLRNGIAYFYLIWYTLEHGLPASQFLLYFASLTGFTQWTKGLLEQFSELRKISLDLTRIREFLEWHEPFLLGKGEPVSNDLSRGYEIRFENVRFRYPESDADTLRGINLTIQAGERLAVVGLNGAGKTTLVKLACGLLDPTEGRVLLNGEDIRKYDRTQLYRLFSAVFQDFSVLEASVEENVSQKPSEYLTEEERERIVSCIRKADLWDKISEIGGIGAKLGREVYDDGVELSGGQLQRLMLARALYKNGAIMILDEPTAALDPIAEHQIYMKYGDMTAGRTSIFISHRLASTRFCDRVLFMKDGNIAEEGTHEMLIAEGGEYARLFAVQSRYYREDSEASRKGGSDAEGSNGAEGRGEYEPK